MARVCAYLVAVFAVVVGFLLFLVQQVQPPPSDQAELEVTKPYHEDHYYTRNEFWRPPSDFSLAGKIALVTGGSSGIGRAAAKELYRLGATVIVTARSQARAQRAADEIMKNSAEAKGEVRGFALELGSNADVKRFASAFLAEYSSLNYLVENAGAVAPIDGTPMTPWVNEEGFESLYASNYLGHFLLLNLLLPALRTTGGDVRITLTSSNVHWHHSTPLEELLPDGRLATSSIEHLGVLDKFRQYGNTKLLQVLMSFELQRRLQLDNNPNITVTAVTPGFVATAIGSSERGEDISNPGGLVQNPDQGAQTTLHALLAPDMKGQTGFFVQPYYTPKHRQPALFGGFFGVVMPFEFIGQKSSWGLYKWLPHPDAHRRDFGKRLWDASLKSVGL